MFVKLSDLLDQSAKKTGIAEQVGADDILQKFVAIVDSDYAKTLKNRVKPLYVKNKTLTVSCESQTVASELKLHERKILAALNEGLSKPVVQTIRFLL